jgi:hypothetical protein
MWTNVALAVRLSGVPDALRVGNVGPQHGTAVKRIVTNGRDALRRLGLEAGARVQIASPR